ncbi:diguanylate cyclase [Halomonas dongshanensis]|uniref:diguanylate cyclase n=1 Tax=Halomonas dongshanensis TaxID=2890835 RepID=A0ABT2ECK4_9GAMM|nr:diguanylate cyclase [Halomonas dongshanensis]MCS2609310.1 diguanylate cyclase [Halomonas dongshanensis]
MSNPQDVFEQRLAAMRHDYARQLAAELGGIQSLLLTPPAFDDRKRLLQAHQRLHRVAGAAGTFGLPNVSQLAKALETLLQDSLEKRAALTSADTARLSDALEALMCEGGGQSEHALLEQAPSVRDEPKAGWSHASGDEGTRATSIWLIEPDQALGEKIAAQLANFSYSVRRFVNIADAEAAERQPDVLLVDAMAENDADGAIGATALAQGGSPLIFISDQDSFEARVRAAQLNAQGYFLKPLNIPHLVSRLEQLLRERTAAPARVLVIDDDTELAEYCQIILESEGMEVQVLASPETIIEEVRSFRPELLLMDVHMPHYDGPDLAAVIRQFDEWSSLPIVFLSAETDLDKQVDALSRGADDFLTKPITAAKLIAAVKARVSRARALSDLLNKDSLTGLLKHASIKSAATSEINRARRAGYPVSIAMVDIDHFKGVNDSYGHATGDVVIASMATLLRQRLRQTDVMGRYGGEEFLVVMPHCPAEAAYQRLETLRQHFAQLRFRHDTTEFGVTLSAGMVCSEEAPDANGDTLVVLADEALYRAKRGGRNQVCCGGALAD